MHVATVCDMLLLLLLLLLLLPANSCLVCRMAGCLRSYIQAGSIIPVCGFSHL